MKQRTRSAEQNKIINDIQKAAKKLNKNSLTLKEFLHFSNIKRSCLYTLFDGWTDAIKQAGLIPTDIGALAGQTRRADEKELLAELIKLDINDIKITTMNVAKHTKFTMKPYYRRFKTLSDAIGKARGGYAAGELDEYLKNEPLALIASPVKSHSLLDSSDGFHSAQSSKIIERLGEKIAFRALVHAPQNEQGVVFLFGMVAGELGFEIEIVQTRFPDIVAKKRYIKNDTEWWSRVRIEAEFDSANFEMHGHNADECEVIVCWKHSWKSVPSHIEVIELQKIIKDLNYECRNASLY